MFIYSMEENHSNSDHGKDTSGCSTLLREWIDSRTLMKAIFHRKMKQIYNDSVANGVVFSAQDTESLILSICDEDILKEFKAYMKDVLIYAQKNENLFLMKRTLAIPFLPLLINGPITSLHDSEEARKEWKMDSPEFTERGALNSLVSSYWCDIKQRKSEYMNLVTSLSSDGDTKTDDVLLFSFGCLFLDFVKGCSLGTNCDRINRTVYGKMLNDILRRKTSDKNERKRKATEDSSLELYESQRRKVSGIDSLLEFVLSARPNVNDSSGSTQQNENLEVEETINYLNEDSITTDSNHTNVCLVASQQIDIVTVR